MPQLACKEAIEALAIDAGLNVQDIIYLGNDVLHLPIRGVHLATHYRLVMPDGSTDQTVYGIEFPAFDAFKSEDTTFPVTGGKMEKDLGIKI